MDAQKLLDLFISQPFEDWFLVDLEAYIVGEKQAKTREQMLADIENFIKQLQ